MPTTTSNKGRPPVALTADQERARDIAAEAATAADLAAEAATDALVAAHHAGVPTSHLAKALDVDARTIRNRLRAAGADRKANGS